MTDTKFTPGPWSVAADYDNKLHVCSPWNDRVKPKNSDTYGSYLGAHICEVPHQGEDAPVVTLTQAKANAHLIAAAPELYEALDLFIDWMNEEEGAHALCDKGRAALAKARGEQ